MTPTETKFLNIGSDRVWCIRCHGWKSTEGEDDPCPPDVPLEECPIQEGDTAKWQTPTLDDAQRAIDALARELSDLDDAASSAANMADTTAEDQADHIKALCGRALSGDQDKRSLVATLEQIVTTLTPEN